VLAILLKIVLMLVAIPGMIAPAATATKPAIKAYSMRSCPRLSFQSLNFQQCIGDQFELVAIRVNDVTGDFITIINDALHFHIDLFRRDQSDFDGTFVLQGVIPGAYTIVAVEDAWGLDWLQPAVLARYVQHGQNISIGDFMTGTIHLPNPIEVQPH